MKSGLHLKSEFNFLLKYADDDTKLLVPENTDVDLADEFRHTMQWANDNKTIINQRKTKEIAQGDFTCFHLLMVRLLSLLKCQTAGSLNPR